MTSETIHELLVFHANGTLDETERATVEAALADDAALRAELETLRAIRATMQADEVQSPGAFGLARLMRDVEAEGRVAPAAPAETPSNVVSITRLRLWQVAAAVVLAAGLGWNLVQMPLGPTATAPQMADPLAEQAPAGYSLAGGDSDAMFTVAFASDATEAEIRSLLVGAGVEIVSGPSALGLYGLSVLEGEDADTARAALASAEIVDDLQ
ncbi:hypothetical protein [Nioella nitratireducens]|uniref:hypothetical protein n=1 Tax=Nioella nitratireducens TaxID=1287720 RepID=UPI0008FD8C6A|nr:hypothetical protein [Nioella nitratireducens]